MPPVDAGTDHTVSEGEGGLILRCAKDAGAADAGREVELLTAVRRLGLFPVPEAKLVNENCLSYPKLPGLALLDLPHLGPGLAAPLAAMVGALHETPLDVVRDFVEHDHFPVAAWLAQAAEEFAAVGPVIPERHVAAIRRFLASAPPADAEKVAFCHNDLGAEHVLVDPRTGAITGIIDWSDAALTDPARDYALLYRDLGPNALAATPPSLRGRAAFYARCSVFEDIAYGLAQGKPRYVTKSVASLEWLFTQE